ncbi:type II toxin-antitoxin system RatA family toxin [Novosphingobium lentum]|uniref:type II toxin-antitoxin system RatA family toxin n=1 Tax=Novosphingobium lentum TaxID=145287 RepID=UPI0008367879|nr:type II toxin-antitoxin system RatA family toxin [Novosphingobium lentum]
MPRITETRHLPFTPEQMFDLVADVGRYAEFLPWVVATRVKSNTESEMVADMLVGFNALREKFTSRVRKTRPREIVVDYLDGPLKKLENNWTFAPDGDDGCIVDFCVDFTFRNQLFERLAGQYVDRAFRKMVAAFESRATALYGEQKMVRPA